MLAKIYLNTTPCQFSESKTKNAIKYITHLVASNIHSLPETGIFHQTIIVTNNSLIDTNQWRSKLNENIYNNVAILSSDSNKSRFTNIDEYIGYTASVNNQADLFNIIVMCNNSIRYNDLETLISTISSNRIDLTSIGIKEIRFSVMFDEVDKITNLSNACKFINFSKNRDNITDIHLITATALKKFWKFVKKHTDIEEIANLRNEIIDELPPPLDQINAYRKITDHTIITYNEHLNDSVEYIKSAFNIFIRNKGQYRLFAPPSVKVKSHTAIRDLFLTEANTIVVVINGKDKTIYYDDVIFESIASFNKKEFPNKENPLMYETLGRLSLRYNTYNIVITGFNCVERGVTFQSTDFHFTHVIIPFIGDPATLTQVIGRDNGACQYVDPNNIIMTSENKQTVIDLQNICINLIQNPPETFTEKDFRKKTNKEKDSCRMFIPEVFSMQEHIFEYITEKKGLKFQEHRILNYLKNNSINVDGYNKVQYMMPRTETTYKKNITPLLIAVQKSEKACFIRSSDRDRNEKLYWIYFDYKNKDLILVKYDGSKEII